MSTARTIFLWASALAVTTGLSFGQEKKPVGVEHVYKRVDGRELRIYFQGAGGGESKPAVVFFHGGSWVSGAPSQFNELGAHLASRGMVVAQAEYRLVPRGSMDPPTICIEDAKSAMRWVRAHARELGVDPQRIASGGGSAGGHLAAFVGLMEGFDTPTDDRKVSAKSNAMLLYNPVFDNGPGGFGYARIGDRYKEYSPLHNIRRGMPPAIVMVGTADKLVPVATVKSFCEKAKAVGARCEALFYDGQPHGFFNYKPDNRYYFETLEATDRFLTELGWLGRRPAQPQAMAPSASHTQIGDLDGDGKSDIALHSREEIAWLQAPGMRQFTVAKGRFTGDRFALADMDKDGDLDFVVTVGAPNVTNEIYWYENPRPGAKSEAGEWKAHRIGDQRAYVKDMVVGDINRDGRLDVVCRSHTHTIIYFGSAGTGPWRTKELTHETKEGLALGDLDGDGDLDLVLNGFWFETPANPETEEFVRHNIDSRWFTQKTGSWQDNNTSVNVGDFNRDGLLDVVIAHSEQTGYPIVWYSVSSKKQARSGPWTPHIVAERYDWCQTLEVADVDGDGASDLVVAQFERDPKSTTLNQAPWPVTIFYNQGKGARWRSEDIGATGVYAGVVGDVGSDGSLELVGPHSYFAGPVQLWSLRPRKPLALDRWHYIQVDGSRTRYDGLTSGGGGWFGLAAGDLNGDGKADIASGKWVYRNPGGDLTGKWERHELGPVVDSVAILDVDSDRQGDVIAVACNKQFWLKPSDRSLAKWTSVKIGELPVCNHKTGAQGYQLAQIVPGGTPEILLTGKGIYVIRVPDDPKKLPWPSITVAAEFINGEGLTTADVDRDGDLDIVAMWRPDDWREKGDFGTVAWWENPGTWTGNWTRHDIGKTTFLGDRIVAGDLDGDGRVDVAVSEERYPGPDPDASLYWFTAPADPTQSWERHTIITEFSLNNLDIADMDHDGDLDLITSEHKGPKPKLQIFENDGRGHFTMHIVDEGRESHLGARLADFDGDGDLDIFSIAWDNFAFLHLWRNDSIRK